MSTYYLYPVTELKIFIIGAVGTLGLLTVLVLYFMAGRKSGMREFGLQALFFVLTGRELLWLAAGICQFVFLISVLFFPVSVGIVQLAALALLCFFRAVLEFTPGAAGGEALYGVMMGVSLLASGLLKDYMKETGTELYIAAIWGLLALFTVQYGLYYFIKSLERLLRAKDGAKQKKSVFGIRRHKKERDHSDER